MISTATKPAVREWTADELGYLLENAGRVPVDALCEAMGIKRLGATMDGTSRASVKKAHERGLIVSLWPGQSVADAILGVYLGADFLCTDIPVEVKTYIQTKAPWVKAVY